MDMCFIYTDNLLTDKLPDMDGPCINGIMPRRCDGRRMGRRRGGAPMHDGQAAGDGPVASLARRKQKHLSPLATYRTE